MNSLVSIRELVRILGVPRENLENLAAHINDHYNEWQRTDPRTGKLRTIRSPSKALKAVQSRIAKRLFQRTEYGPEVQGGVRSKSPATNATIHLHQPCVVAVDVRKFFPSVKHTVVYDMLRTELGHGRQVAGLVTRLVTYDGQLPQGAPTSTAVANALLHLPVDTPVNARARELGLAFSRYIDDLAASGHRPQDIINLIARQLSKRQLAISRKEKLKIMPSSGPQEITGLLVNGTKPSLSRKRRDRVRAAIHDLRQMPDGTRRRKAMQSVLGRIRHVGDYNPGSAARLERQLQAEPKP